MGTGPDAWLDAKDHSVEGHTLTCTLKFNGDEIWGPKSCHSNTRQLKDALHKADKRFDMDFDTKDKTDEGHTRYISVMSSDGTVLLDKLSTHDNMMEMISAMYNALKS